LHGIGDVVKSFPEGVEQQMNIKEILREKCRCQMSTKKGGSLQSLGNVTQLQDGMKIKFRAQLGLGGRDSASEEDMGFSPFHFQCCIGMAERSRCKKKGGGEEEEECHVKE